MARPPLSVTILTLNEESRIERAISSVKGWANDVLVVDSGSQDRTREIALALGARVIENPWPGYGAQKNFAQERAAHDWVLNIDADELVPPALAAEIDRALAAPGEAVGFTLPRRNFYLGRWIRHGGWYPNRLCRLAHRGHARWSEPRVHEALVVKGETRELSQALDHHGFHSIHEQVLTNERYARLGAEELARRGVRGGIGRLLFKPAGKFLETYVVKRGFLDGLAGFIISVNAAYSVFMKHAYLLETDIRHEDPDHR